MYTNDKVADMTNVTSTGSLRLDRALGAGGVPRGQVCEISGPPGSGKSTLCYHILAQAQKRGEECAWVDVDHTFNTPYAAACGIQPHLFYICRPASIQAALAITESLVRSSAFAAVAIDSVSSLAFLPDTQAQPGVSQSSLPTALFALLLPHLKKLCLSSQTTLLATSLTPPGHEGPLYHQLHDHLDRMALQLHADIRLQMYEAEQQSDPDLGEWVNVRMIKNTFVPAYFVTKLFFMYNQGIAKAIECFDLGVELEVIRITGLGCFCQGLHLGDGRKESVSFLRQNPDQLKEIEELIRLKYFSPA